MCKVEVTRFEVEDEKRRGEICSGLYTQSVLTLAQGDLRDHALSTPRS